MAPRTASTQPSHNAHPTPVLDPVAPTAIASVEARRQAHRTLRYIDALLALDGSDGKPLETDHAITSPSSKSETTPGPGTYDPHKEQTMWQRPASVTLHRATRAPNKPTAVLRYEHARAQRTPGPGAYEITAADRMVKPRVRTATFRPETETGRCHRTADDDDDEASRTPLAPARADKWLSRYTEPKGAVAYRPATSVAATRAQRDRLRQIRGDKTRHTRVGFYNVAFALTERRTGALGIVPMATPSVHSSTRHTQARTRRQLRAWHQPTAVTTKTPGADGKRASSGLARATTAKTTIQWQRARSRALLQQREAQQCVQKSCDGRDSGRLATTTQLRDLVAHAMARHSGRDTVRCPRKNVRVTTAFASPLPKQRHISGSSISRPTSRSATQVAYDKMQGRDEFVVDAHGVYLLGLER